MASSLVTFFTERVRDFPSLLPALRAITALIVHHAANALKSSAAATEGSASQASSSLLPGAELVAAALLGAPAGPFRAFGWSLDEANAATMNESDPSGSSDDSGGTPVHWPACPQPVRQAFHGLLASLLIALTRTSSASSNDDSSGVASFAVRLFPGFLEAFEGEKDPRVLLAACRVATQLLETMGAPPPPSASQGGGEAEEESEGTSSGRMLEDGRAFGAGLASVLGMYFPITFTPPKDDPHKITQVRCQLLNHGFLLSYRQVNNSTKPNCLVTLRLLGSFLIFIYHQPMLAAALRSALVGPSASRSGTLPHALPLLLEHLTLPNPASGNGDADDDDDEGGAVAVDHNARTEALRCVRLAARTLAAAPRHASTLAALRPFLVPLSSRLMALALADPSPPGTVFASSSASELSGSSAAGGPPSPSSSSSSSSSSSLVACVAHPPAWLLDSLPGAGLHERGEADGCYDAPTGPVGPPNPSAEASECAALARSALAAWAALVASWATGDGTTDRDSTAVAALSMDTGSSSSTYPPADTLKQGENKEEEESRAEAVAALAESQAAWGAMTEQQERNDWAAFLTPAFDHLVPEVRLNTRERPLN